MKTTYDPRPAPLGWLARLVQRAVEFALVALLAALLPRSR